MPALLIAVAFALLAAPTALFRRKEPPAPSAADLSLARAVPGTATVVSAGRSESTSSSPVASSSSPYVIELDVEAPGITPYRAKVEWTVFDAAVADVQPGSRIAVAVDPQIPAIVYPPGYPPPTTKPGVISLADARLLPTSAWLERLVRTA